MEEIKMCCVFKNSSNSIQVNIKHLKMFHVQYENIYLFITL